VTKTWVKPDKLLELYRALEGNSPNLNLPVCQAQPQALKLIQIGIKASDVLDLYRVLEGSSPNMNLPTSKAQKLVLDMVSHGHPIIRHQNLLACYRALEGRSPDMNLPVAKAQEETLKIIFKCGNPGKIRDLFQFMQSSSGPKLGTSAAQDKTLQFIEATGDLECFMEAYKVFGSLEKALECVESSLLWCPCCESDEDEELDPVVPLKLQLKMAILLEKYDLAFELQREIAGKAPDSQMAEINKLKEMKLRAVAKKDFREAAALKKAIDALMK
jgi:hypothetical protein